MSPQISKPATVISVAAPADRPLLDQWETHLLPFQQNGRVTHWSHYDIPPGMNRQQEITRHFAGANAIVLLLSADFFADTECYRLMNLAVQQARSDQSYVIPLLLRPVGWRATPLSDLSCMPANGRPVTRWGDRDEAFEDCVAGLVGLLGAPIPQEGLPSTPRRQMDQLSPARHYSCFISYSSQDEALAQRLYRDLKARGIDCWFAPHDMRIGARIRPTIDRAIHRQEKLLLLLSEHSIASAWVEDEVEAALERERSERREMLFPLRLDDSVTRPAVPAWAARLRRQINIGNFTSWADSQAYQRAFERLIHDLENADEAEPLA
ncbi:MAG TPA: toll/interleukin-1 receptor domain-containing protein [Ktedonobacteraceae bacterium]|jgi:hypothetical protein